MDSDYASDLVARSEPLLIELFVDIMSKRGRRGGSRTLNSQAQELVGGEVILIFRDTSQPARLYFQ